jgi:hypothetical protein
VGWPELLRDLVSYYALQLDDEFSNKKEERKVLDQLHNNQLSATDDTQQNERSR